MKGKLTGQIIAGKYRVLDLYVDYPYELYHIECEGRCNELFLRTYRKYADKTTNRHIIQEPLFLKRLDHPAFPRIMSITEDDLYYYVIRETINGRYLQHILDEEHLSEGMIINYSLQICEAVRYLASADFHFVFGLITPSYICVQPDNSLKFLGIDYWLGCQEGCRFAILCENFQAPEALFMKSEDIRSVIYTIGQVIRTMIERLAQQNPSFVGSMNHKKLSKIITKCTHINPKRRYQTCDKLISALKRPAPSTYVSLFSKDNVIKLLRRGTR